MDNVDFLTKEHSKTLGGLHHEIQKLQGRCDELTFRLHFTESASSSENELDRAVSQNNNETISCLKTQLEDVTKSLGTELHRKNEMIQDLHNQLLEANLNIKEVSDKYQLSQASLEAKSKTIAFLTSKLNHLKSMLAKQSDLPSPTPPPSFPDGPRAARRTKKSDPANASTIFAEESFDNACFRSLPPSLEPITSPKMLVPTPPADAAKKGTYSRHTRRYSAPKLRTNFANESLPLALLPDDKVHPVSIPSKPAKKLILPPIPSTARETQPKNGPMVGNLQSPESFKHPQKTSHSTHVKDF